jgi:type VI secretion system protein ImpE
MQAKELFARGQLSAAIEQLNAEIRSHPTDVQRRTFLFELLCFAGEYQRAERQLDVLARQGSTAAIGTQVYRHILLAEQARSRLLTDGLGPDFLGDVPPHIHLHLHALNHLRADSPGEARALLEQAAHTRPRLHGSLQGQRFEDFRDGDDILAPVLEVILQAHYVWVPFEQIKRLEVAAPQHLRDLLWIPATLELHTGPVGHVFLPVLYAGSSQHVDERIKLGRMTDWQSMGAGLMRGLGRHMFLVGDEDTTLLEVRDIEFQVEASTGA